MEGIRPTALNLKLTRPMNSLAPASTRSPSPHGVGLAIWDGYNTSPARKTAITNRSQLSTDPSAQPLVSPGVGTNTSRLRAIESGGGWDTHLPKLQVNIGVLSPRPTEKEGEPRSLLEPRKDDVLDTEESRALEAAQRLAEFHTNAHEKYVTTPPTHPA